MHCERLAHRAFLTFLFAFSLASTYSASLTAQDVPPDAQRAAEAAYQARVSDLEQQLTTLRGQGNTEESPQVRDVEGQLLTLAGERQESNEVQFAQSKSLFSKPNFYRVPVLYVTDRKKTQGVFEASSRPNGELEYGIATTTIKSDVPLGTDLVPGALNLGQNSKTAPPMTKSLSGMSGLLAEINARKVDPTGKPRKVLLFIHGYNNSFDNAVEDAALLASEVQVSVIPVAYSWPSAHQFAKYGQDSDQVKISEVAFADFLAESSRNLRSRSSSSRIAWVHGCSLRVYIKSDLRKLLTRSSSMLCMRLPI